MFMSRLHSFASSSSTTRIWGNNSPGPRDYYACFPYLPISSHVVPLGLLSYAAKFVSAASWLTSVRHVCTTMQLDDHIDIIVYIYVYISYIINVNHNRMFGRFWEYVCI